MREIKIRTRDDYIVTIDGSENEAKEIACADAAVKLTFGSGLRVRAFFDHNVEAWCFESLYDGREPYEVSYTSEEPDTLCCIVNNSDIESYEVEDI